MKQRLLVSIRGPKEAETAIRGGAQIVDVEYPASALGTPYPLNILAVSEAVNKLAEEGVQISTNIGEVQSNRSSSCQAALGVALAGADLIKFGLAELPLDRAIYLGNSIVRTVVQWFPNKKLYPALFVDSELTKILNPFQMGAELVKSIGSDGLLIDTFDKSSGEGLLDYCSISDIKRLGDELHALGKEIWIAGSITADEIGSLWTTGVDVICVRAAACLSKNGEGRFGAVDKDLIKMLLPQ